MAKKAKVKTQKSTTNVSQYIAQVKDENLRKDCQILVKVFKKATGKPPKIWETRFIGFGEFKYRRANGDEIKYFTTAFRPGKSELVIYIMSGLENAGGFLMKLGPHKKTGSCLYLKSMDEIDLVVLEKIIKAGVKNLKFKFDMKQS